MDGMVGETSLKACYVDCEGVAAQLGITRESLIHAIRLQTLEPDLLMDGCAYFANGRDGGEIRDKVAAAYQQMGLPLPEAGPVPQVQPTVEEIAALAEDILRTRGVLPCAQAAGAVAQPAIDKAGQAGVPAVQAVGVLDVPAPKAPDREARYAAEIKAASDLDGLAAVRRQFTNDKGLSRQAFDRLLDQAVAYGDQLWAAINEGAGR
jgi:hypothetical protein